jgi:hypothetical protein
MHDESWMLKELYLDLPRKQRTMFLNWVPELVQMRKWLADPEWLAHRLAELRDP